MYGCGVSEQTGGRHRGRWWKNFRARGFERRPPRVFGGGDEYDVLCSDVLKGSIINAMHSTGLSIV